MSRRNFDNDFLDMLFDFPVGTILAIIIIAMILFLGWGGIMFGERWLFSRTECVEASVVLMSVDPESVSTSLVPAGNGVIIPITVIDDRDFWIVAQAEVVSPDGYKQTVYEDVDVPVGYYLGMDLNDKVIICRDVGKITDAPWSWEFESVLDG